MLRQIWACFTRLKYLFKITHIRLGLEQPASFSQIKMAIFWLTCCFLKIKSNVIQSVCLSPMFGTMLTKLLWFVTAVTIQGGYLPSSCQIDTASSAVYIALYPTNRSLREELIDTLSKTFFSIPHFNSGIHHFTHFTAGIDSQCRNYLL